MLNTVFLLMAQYNGRALIPVEQVCQDYFSHLTLAKFIRKCSMGEIQLPIVRLDPSSQKSAKGVHLSDLAAYLDLRREAAIKECTQMT